MLAGIIGALRAWTVAMISALSIPCRYLALASPADSPPNLLREATEPRFGGGVRLDVEVAINRALQAP